MAGFTEQITFLYVADLTRSAVFYGETLGFDLVTDQGDCLIYKVVDGAYLGVCVRPERAKDGVIVTLVTDNVDGWHDSLMAADVECVSAPSRHVKYDIYQAFYRDPDGYLIEIQRFGDPTWSHAR